MKIKKSFLLLIFAGFFLTSCNKNVDIPCVAGQGGSLTLILKPEHHEEPIISTAAYPDSAFIKFNAREFPGTNASAYDLIVVGTEGADSVVVENLLCGNYFIYMTGFDNGIQQVVRGGIPATITKTTGTLTLKIPITE